MGVIIEEVDILPTEKNPWSLWGVFHGGTDTLPLSSHYHRNEVFKTGGVRRTLSGNTTIGSQKKVRSRHSFQLDEPLTLSRSFPARKTHKSCVSPTKTSRHRLDCPNPSQAEHSTSETHKLEVKPPRVEKTRQHFPNQNQQKQELFS